MMSDSGYVLCLTGNRRMNKRMTVFFDSLLQDGQSVRVLSLPRGPWSFEMMEQQVPIQLRTMTADVGMTHGQRVAGIVCFHWFMLPLAVLLGFLLRRHVVYDEHDHYELNTLEGTASRVRRVVSQQLIRGMHRFCLPWVSLVTCIHMNQQVLKRHLEQWRCEALELHNYPAIVWRETSDRFASQPATPVCFVYIGGVYAEKGVRVAADAFAALPERLGDSAELHIFGSGDPTLIAELRQRPSVTLHDEVTPSEFRSYAAGRRCCGLALLTNHPRYNLVGTNCTKLYEYLALGMPVLGTSVGEFPEFILGHDVGLIVDARIHSDELTAAMGRMIEQPEEFARFAANARQLMSHDEMTWEHEWRKLTDRGLLRRDVPCRIAGA